MMCLWLLAVSVPESQILTTVAGGGAYPNGPALQRPIPEIVDLDCATGSCYVSTLAGVLKIDSGGMMSRVFGPDEAARFSTYGHGSDNGYGTAVAAGSDGTLYVLLRYKIFKIAPSGSITIVANLAQSTSQPMVINPTRMTVDGAGTIFVNDAFAHKIYRVSSAGVIAHIAGNGQRSFSGDGGPAVAAALSAPVDLAADSAGSLFLADSNNRRVRKIDSAGTISTVVEVPSDDFPGSLAVDSKGNIFFEQDGSIRKRSPSGDVSIVAGGGTSLEDGVPATSAQVAKPIATDSTGNLVLTDGRWRIRKVGADGLIATIAGNGKSTWGDEGPAPSGFLTPLVLDGLAIDSEAGIYVAEFPLYFIRRVTPDGILSTVAGNGTRNTSGNGGPSIAAEVIPTGGTAFDIDGGLLFAEATSIRRIAPDGSIQTAARWQCCIHAFAMAVSPTGDIYLFAYDGTRRVSRVTGRIETVPTLGSAAQGTFDANGNLYSLHSLKRQVFKFTTSDVLSTVAGSGPQGPLSGDGGPATSAVISPGSIAVDSNGDIYLAEKDYARNGSYRIRKIDSAGIIRTVAVWPGANDAGSFHRSG